MSLWFAIAALALVQGATEFLPVSSSGHLSLAHSLLGQGEADVLTDVVLHFGTLLAVVWHYRDELLRTIKGFVSGVWDLAKGDREGAKANSGFMFSLYVCSGTLSTMVIALSLKDWVEGVLRGPVLVGSMLLLNGAILFSAPRHLTQTGAGEGELGAGLSLKTALLIGLLQGIAVIPGISRSGLTIPGALWLGLSGTQAARFSFILSIPAISGALILHLGELAPGQQVDWGGLALGATVAAFVGTLCLRFLVGTLKRARFHHFAWYCWALGLTAVALSVR